MRWEEAWDLGDDLSASSLAADQPELIALLQVQIDALKKMSWMKKDVEDGDLDQEFCNDVLIGQKLAGRYLVEEQIGEGGFGRVYRAFDPELERHVAVKFSKRDTSSVSNELLDEAKRTAKLRHAGIVSIHDVGRHNGSIFFVSELIDGQSLEESISEKRLTIEQATKLIATVADALQFAHRQGFIHRDIKPSNILLDRDGNPHIADFGIAGTVEQIALIDRPTSGTLPYMAPEQVAGEVQLIDSRTDIYALGVVLFELLAGGRPFQARTPLALREKILFTSPTPLRQTCPGISKRLEAICHKAIAKHPAERFATASSFAEALRKAQQVSAPRVLQFAIVVAVLLALPIAIVMMVRAKMTTTNPARVTSRETLLFDGTNRIVTPVERLAPVTLEAWIKPTKLDDKCHFVIGSDIPTKYGIGLGICGLMLTAERIVNEGEFGLIRSSQLVPVNEWSHIAAVFGAQETRLYFNGKLVETGPPTQVSGGTPFVIGNVGEQSPLDYFHGEIKEVRISKGERYLDNFAPLQDGDSETSSDSILLYKDISFSEERVTDQSGNGNHEEPI